MALVGNFCKASSLALRQCLIRANGGNGISCTQSELNVEETRIINNAGYGAAIRGGTAKFIKCHFDNGQGLLLQEEDCKLSCSQNSAPAATLSKQNLPGFRAEK